MVKIHVTIMSVSSMAQAASKAQVLKPVRTSFKHPPRSCVTLGTLFRPSGPQFPYLQNENTHSTCLTCSQYRTRKAMGKRLSRSLGSLGWILRNCLISLKRTISPGRSNPLFPVGISTLDEISFWVWNLWLLFVHPFFCCCCFEKSYLHS